MDKNTVTGLLLIFAILIGYSLWTRPSREEIARRQRQQDSIAIVNQAEQARLAEEMRKMEEQARFAVLDTAVVDSLRQRDLQNNSELLRRR